MQDVFSILRYFKIFIIFSFITIKQISNNYKLKIDYLIDSIFVGTFYLEPFSVI